MPIVNIDAIYIAGSMPPSDESDDFDSIKLIVGATAKKATTKDPTMSALIEDIWAIFSDIIFLN